MDLKCQTLYGVNFVECRCLNIDLVRASGKKKISFSSVCTNFFGRHMLMFDVHILNNPLLILFCIVPDLWQHFNMHQYLNLPFTLLPFVWLLCFLQVQYKGVNSLFSIFCMKSFWHSHMKSSYSNLRKRFQSSRLNIVESKKQEA